MVQKLHQTTIFIAIITKSSPPISSFILLPPLHFHPTTPIPPPPPPLDRSFAIFSERFPEQGYTLLCSLEPSKQKQLLAEMDHSNPLKTSVLPPSTPTSTSARKPGLRYVVLAVVTLSPLVTKSSVVTS